MKKVYLYKSPEVSDIAKFEKDDGGTHGFVWLWDSLGVLCNSNLLVFVTQKATPGMLGHRCYKYIMLCLHVETSHTCLIIDFRELAESNQT